MPADGSTNMPWRQNVAPASPTRPGDMIGQREKVNVIDPQMQGAPGGMRPPGMPGAPAQKK